MAFDMVNKMKEEVDSSFYCEVEFARSCSLFLFCLCNRKFCGLSSFCEPQIVEKCRGGLFSHRGNLPR